MAMFESLSNRLDAIFDRLRGHGTVTENDIKEAMREVRQALLEADVNFKLVKQFVTAVQEKALGVEVLKGLNPGQQVISIVYDQLVEMLGGVDDKPKITYAGAPPTVIMLVGLQGSGKTTTISKLALTLRKQKQKPVMVACDMQRPAAVAQLQQLGKQLDIPVYSEPAGNKPVDIALRSLAWAKEQAATIVLIDTAGRLHVDEDLMREVQVIQERTKPQETLLVVDAMTGQDAVRVAEAFHETVKLTGLIMTKMDGDARGGAALSIRAITGVPIKFMGIGEKSDALEPFYADRLAQRILGMGDVLTLIERARENIDEEQAAKMQEKLLKATFDLEDFLQQMRQIKKMGSLVSIMEMIPGLSKLPPEAKEAMKDEKELKRVEAIILSMTPAERHNPKIINGSRRLRIAKGSGMTSHDVNELLKSFRDMQQMMKQMGAMQQGKGGNRRLMRALRGMGGGMPGLPGM